MMVQQLQALNFEPGCWVPTFAWKPQNGNQTANTWSAIATDSFSFSVISPRWFRHHSRHQSGIMALVFTSSQRRGGWERWSLWMSALPPDLFHTCPDTALGLHAASLPLLMRCTKQMVRYACCWPQPFAESEVHGRDYHTKLCTFCVKKKIGVGGGVVFLAKHRTAKDKDRQIIKLIARVKTDN